MICWFLFLKSSKWATTSVYQLNCDSHKQTLALAQQTFNGLIFTFDRRSRQNEVKELKMIREKMVKKMSKQRKNKSKLTFVSIYLNERALPPDDDFVCQLFVLQNVVWMTHIAKINVLMVFMNEKRHSTAQSDKREIGRYVVRSYCDDFIVGISTSFISWLIYLFVNQIYAI